MRSDPLINADAESGGDTDTSGADNYQRNFAPQTGVQLARIRVGAAGSSLDSNAKPVWTTN